MAAGIYTKPLGDLATGVGGAYSLFTADSPCVLRDVTYNLFPGAAVNVAVTRSGIARQVVYIDNSAGTNQLCETRECRVALAPGDTIEAFVYNAVQTELTLTGYIFT